MIKKTYEYGDTEEMTREELAQAILTNINQCLKEKG